MRKAILNCRQITEHSSDYIDNNLNWWQTLQMKLHLMMCYLCRRYIKQFRFTVKSITYAPLEMSNEEAVAFVKSLQSKYQPGENS